MPWSALHGARCVKCSELLHAARFLWYMCCTTSRNSEGCGPRGGYCTVPVARQDSASHRTDPRVRDKVERLFDGHARVLRHDDIHALKEPERCNMQRVECNNATCSAQRATHYRSKCTREGSKKQRHRMPVARAPPVALIVASVIQAPCTHVSRCTCRLQVACCTSRRAAQRRPRARWRGA